MKEVLEIFFSNYLKAFKNYHLQGVCKCYALPCTLNTPDKMLLIESMASCEQEFTAIFAQLKQENTKEIVVKQSSFTALSESLLLISIDWEFVNQAGDIFANFCAFYHIGIYVKDRDVLLEIVNVASHDIDNSLSLTTAFSIV